MVGNEFLQSVFIGWTSGSPLQSLRQGGRVGRSGARAAGALLPLALLAACSGGSGDGGAAAPTVSAVTVGPVKYSQSLLITVDGTALDALPTVTSAACTGMVRSTTAPNISSPTRAYYTCTVSATGAASVTVAYNGTTLRTQTYTVPEPQVTLSIANGAGLAGDIVLTLDPTRTPITTNNFLRYVNDGFYNGTIFHRVLSGFVAQGGGLLPLVAGQPAEAKAGLRAPIALEVGKGLSNTALTVAMARTNVADSATAQFFINLVNNAASLDPSAITAGYAVFGSVTAGADVVNALAAVPCAARTGVSECAPTANVVMTQVSQTR